MPLTMGGFWVSHALAMPSRDYRGKNLFVLRILVRVILRHYIAYIRLPARTSSGDCSKTSILNATDLMWVRTSSIAFLVTVDTLLTSP